MRGTSMDRIQITTLESTAITNFYQSQASSYGAGVPLSLLPSLVLQAPSFCLCVAHAPPLSLRSISTSLKHQARAESRRTVRRQGRASDSVDRPALESPTLDPTR